MGLITSNTKIDFNKMQNYKNDVISQNTKGIEFLLRFAAFEIVPVLVELIAVGIVLWVTFGLLYALVTVTTVIIYILR